MAEPRSRCAHTGSGGPMPWMAPANGPIRLPGGWHDRHACPTISRGASPADRDALERARSRKPPDRGGINRIGASDIGHRLAGDQTLQRLLALMWRHLARPTEAHAAILRTLASLASARADQLTLELGKAAKHREHQAAVRRRGVGPGVLERAKARTALGDLVEHEA